ncbi:MAG: hypothetical protein U0132_19480 [Gemmatimonadaceae bacterium]
MRRLFMMLTGAALAACRQDTVSPVASLAAASPDANVQLTTWQITLLEPSGNFEFGRSYGINDSNVVVGAVRAGFNPANTRAFMWRGGLFSILSFGTNVSGSTARGINLRGEVSGWVAGPWHPFSAEVPFNADTAYFRSASGTVTRLPRYHGNGGGGYDINNFSEIAGFLDNGFGIPVEWRKVNGAWTIGLLPTFGGGYVIGFNASGVAAGTFIEPLGGGAYDTGAFYTQLNGPSYSFSTLGTPTCGSDVNNAGSVVGLRSTGTNSTVWDVVNFVPILGAVPIGVQSAANTCIENGPRINSAGRIVGTTANNLPYTWKSGSLTYLPLPYGAATGTAGAVNTCGVVAGSVRILGLNKDFPVIWRRYNNQVLVCD